jgi:hypothetical protein
LLSLSTLLLLCEGDYFQEQLDLFIPAVEVDFTAAEVFAVACIPVAVGVTNVTVHVLYLAVVDPAVMAYLLLQASMFLSILRNLEIR